MKKIITLIFLVSLSQIIFSQTYQINTYNGQTINTCSGTFYDSGGDAGSYAVSEDYSVTFHSNNGTQIYISFFNTAGTFDTEANYDYLDVYDGQNTSAPYLGRATGNEFFSVASHSGYLHFVWHSDGSVTATGWKGIISCVSTGSGSPSDQDCLGAIPICGNSYYTTLSYSGSGNYGYELDGVSSCLRAGEKNDVWYVFNVQQAGNLTFSIIPNSASNDYDWAVYNITNNTCNDLFLNDALEVSCNYSALTGSTGCATGSTSNHQNGSASSTNWNAPIPVVVGQTYVINVSNWSTTGQSGYTIDFSSSSGTVVDVTPPYLQQITSSPACGQSTVTFNFSERVLCSSVQNGDFTVTGPGGPYSITSVNCNAGTTESESFTITLNQNLTAGGSYNLNLVGQVSDACNNLINSNSLSFSVSGVSATATINSHVNCSGGNNGSATAAGSGGTPPYTYLWSNAATTATVSSLTAGTYTVTVRDNLGLCNTTASVVITQPSVLSSSIVRTNVNCNGGNNGTATVSASGGTAGYTYLWSNSQTTATISGLIANNYSVTVTDSHSCTSVSSTTVSQPAVVSGSISAQTNVNCNGGNNGSATVLAAGGTSPYTYLWSNSQTGATATTLIAGTYTVTIRDVNNCTGTQSATINQPTVLTATSSATNTSCNGGNNGTATTTPSGGTSPYSYIWFPSGQTTATATNLTPNNYSVTITDSHGCTLVKTATVGQPGAIGLTTSKTDATCGNSNGSATVSASGGTPSYTYAWSNSGSTATITNLLAGSYTVTVRDANNCSSVSTVSVNNTGAPSVSLTASSNVSCFGGSNGSATISATGGTPGYSYLWSNGGTGTSISGVVSNSYSVTVTDALGCQASTSVNITQPTAVSATVTGNVSPLCFGGTNGTATVSASGGTPGYTYLWSNSATTATATGLGAGSYSVTVYDSRSCSSTSSTNITQPSQLSSVISSTTNVNCNSGSDGSASVTASGGTVSYTYLWSNGGSTATITNLATGSYSVTVTDSHSCTSTTSTTINQPSALLLTIPSVSNVACNGGSNGSATATTTGGTAGYTYSWSNGTPTANNSGLTAGTYSVTVTDSHSCTATSSINISEPTLLSASASQSQQISCFGGNNGTASASATGGTPSYSYHWSNGSNNANTGGLSNGVYTVTVTDINLCTSVATLNVVEPQLISLNSVTDSVLCYGLSTGQIDLTVSGGTSPFSYLWNDNSTNEDRSNIPVGTYTVTVTDNNICTSVYSVSVYQSANLTATFTIADAHCGLNDGSLTVNATGGTPGYLYQWDANAANQTTALASNLISGSYNVTITDNHSCNFVFTGNVSDLNAAVVAFDVTTNNLCFEDSLGFAHSVVTSGGTSPFTFLWSNGSVTDSIYNVAAGTYSVTVTDANGCITIQSVNITEPSELQLSISSITPILCYGGNNGSVTINVTGGTSPYSYLWSNLATTPTISNLTAGTYQLTVTDLNNCIRTFSGPFTEPTQISSVILEPTLPKCYNSNNGQAIVIASGGTAPFSFIWNDALNTPNDTVSTLAGNADYIVTITDINSCTHTDTVHINAPIQLNITGNTIQANCSASNGSANIAVTGGTAPYTYIWTTGSQNDTIINLASGNYTVTVYDSNACSATYTANINNISAGTVQVTQLTNVLCYGSSTGSITATMLGGTPPFSFIWSSGETTGTVSNMSAGSYSVTVSDNNNCSDDTTITITQPTSGLSSSITSNNISCIGSNNGTLIANASGGTTPYTYLWTGGSTNSTVTGLPSGIYNLTVSDANNCTSTNIATISQPTALSYSVTYTNPTCGNGTNGTASVINTNGGTPPYTYAWTGGISDSIATGLSAGVYTVTITDSHMCDTVSIVTLFDPLSFVISDTAIGLDANNMGYITLTVTGGQLPYTYLWSNGNTNASNTNLPAGDYIITITDANTCAMVDTFTIDIPLEIPTVITPNGDGKNDDFEIIGIAGYSDVSIEIFNRWGDVLFSFNGTGMEYTDAAKRWNGIFNGNDLPMGGYVYIVKLGEDKDPVTGVVSIIR
ncbi:MAG: gliding motility-associated C-terminal domain-containing protein [Bacteroidia bacterium]|nr:gliding motility-associated C-terminal domain-containing protein [Bacteroidia bacterium]